VQIVVAINRQANSGEYKSVFLQHMASAGDVIFVTRVPGITIHLSAAATRRIHFAGKVCAVTSIPPW
jgi:hypothetical protein